MFPDPKKKIIFKISMFLFQKQDLKLASYRIGGGIGLGEKSSLREIAKIECILVLENVEVGVIKLVFENWERN